MNYLIFDKHFIKKIISFNSSIFLININAFQCQVDFKNILNESTGENITNNCKIKFFWKYFTKNSTNYYKITHPHTKINRTERLISDWFWFINTEDSNDFNSSKFYSVEKILFLNTSHFFITLKHLLSTFLLFNWNRWVVKKNEGNIPWKFKITGILFGLLIS